MFILYVGLLKNVVYCINTDLKMVTLNVQCIGKIQYDLKWKGLTGPEKNTGRNEEMLLNQGSNGEMVLGSVMKGDPMRQNLVLVYQTGSERKYKGLPDDSAGKDTCDAT